MGCVEKVLLGVIVGRSGDNDKVSVFVRFPSVECRPQSQRLLRQVFLDIFILDWRYLFIDFLHLLGDNVDRHDLIRLRKKRRHAHTNVSSSRNRNLLHIYYFFKQNKLFPKS